MNPSSSSSTIVTKEATITINAGIRTRFGMMCRSSDMIALLSTSTAVVVSPMPSPFMADVVTASVGHIPSVRTKVGFSFTSPLKNTSMELCFTSLFISLIASTSFGSHKRTPEKQQAAVHPVDDCIRGDRRTADRIDLAVAC